MDTEPGTVHKPFISDEEKIPEFTPVPLITGALLGMIFGASSLYLVLKVGMTISASIPVAVISITLFRMFSRMLGVRKATILENNIVQTTGSAGESIAFGVGVTMPALLIMGYDMEVVRVITIASLGALLGILMMIPLRRGLIVKEHGKLMYPEGTACAEVLIVGEQGGTSAKTVFTGFFLGFFYKILLSIFKLWKDIPEITIKKYMGAVIAGELTPELLGVGYIIGAATGCLMMAGAVLASLVIIPLIRLFGNNLTEPLYPGMIPISQMSNHDVWAAYVLYIGAGAVAAGGIISLFSSLPVIIGAARTGLKNFSTRNGSSKIKRTEDDLPMSFVILGSLGLIVLLTLTPMLHLNILGAILILIFGFLFVTVSSRLTGEIGSSSNPISGMTVSTLLLTCLIFVALGLTGLDYRVTALSIAAVVCVAASNAGNTSQDLKTGFLIGATPKYQQISLFIGALASAFVIGFVLISLNDSGTVYSKKAALALPPIKFSTAGLKKTTIPGPEGKTDNKEYFVLNLKEETTEVTTGKKILAGKYLLAEDGSIAYVVDPGINGKLNERDDGSKVDKYEAPKARLMSLIIDGILTGKLPWVLVIIGAFISIMLELVGVSSLPFAVGVYLPMSASTPIFLGGLVRWLVDRQNRREVPEQVNEQEAESSPGVLLSSGLIAGGSIAGICFAILAGRYMETLEALDMTELVETSIIERLVSATGYSPEIVWAVFSTIPFVILAYILYLVGRKKLLNN